VAQMTSATDTAWKPPEDARRRRRLKLSVPAGVMALLVLTMLVGPWVWHASATQQDLAGALARPAFLGGSRAHPLGTDEFGRDVLARLLEGGRISLAVAAAAVVGAGVIGIPAGLAAGYFGGLIDSILMRLVDVQLAFPPFLLALSLISGLKAGTLPILIILILSSWVQFGRFVRTFVLSRREAQYIEAAKCMGAKPTRIMVHDLLPNVTGVVLVVSTFAFSEAVILLAALSFLGVGIQPPTPSWGAMIADGLPYMTNAWWMSVTPGVLLMVTIVCANLVADGLRDPSVAPARLRTDGDS
jgi:peptide/nickel transport system permease protein